MKHRIRLLNQKAIRTHLTCTLQRCHSRKVIYQVQYFYIMLPTLCWWRGTILWNKKGSTYRPEPYRRAVLIFYFNIVAVRVGVSVGIRVDIWVSVWVGVRVFGGLCTVGSYWGNNFIIFVGFRGTSYRIYSWNKPCIIEKSDVFVLLRIFTDQPSRNSDGWSCGRNWIPFSDSGKLYFGFTLFEPAWSPSYS